MANLLEVYCMARGQPSSANIRLPPVAPQHSTHIEGSSRGMVLWGCVIHALGGLTINTQKSKTLWTNTLKIFMGDYIWLSSLTQRARGNRTCPGSHVSQTLMVAHSSVGIPRWDVAHLEGCKYGQQGGHPGPGDIPSKFADQCVAIIGPGVDMCLQGPPTDSPGKKQKSGDYIKLK